MNKVCVILRGLPGAGKTTLAELLAQHLDAVIASANHFFEQSGTFVFDRTKLGAAHAFCFAEFANAVGRKQSVIIDNTNSTRDEYLTYVGFATLAGYKIVIIEIDGLGRQQRHLFYSRNIHHVPVITFDAMARRWEPDDKAVMISWDDFQPDRPLPDKILKALNTGGEDAS